MTDRIIDLSESAAYLRVEHRQLVIERPDQPQASVPLTETAAVVLAHPRASCSLPAFGGLMDAGAAVVVCNGRNLPVGMMLPLVSHSTQTQRFAAQAGAALPLKKRLWQRIVKRKILAQAELLVELRDNDFGLVELARRVRSGDAGNLESQAARRYWPALFDNPAFRRRYDAEDQNRLLNYGYAVLRAVVGRAICAAGLHPSLGLHHHNQYNAFCLADDLMEPYRPLVDAAVVQHAASYGQDAPLDRLAKQSLLEAITKPYRADDEVRTLFEIISRTACSLAGVYLGERRELTYPGELTDAGS